MAGGYNDPKSGAVGLAAAIKGLQRQIDAIKSSAGLTSATIGKGGITTFDPDTGGRIFLGEGAIEIWDNFNTNPDGFGRIYCDPGSGLNVIRIFPPYSDGDGKQNSITVQGGTPTTAGGVWLYSDGNIQLRCADELGELNLNGIILFSSRWIQMLDLQASSSAANVTVSAEGFLYKVTSSRRYKQDIEDAAIDPSLFLKLRPRTWRDKNDVLANPDTTQRFVGFIAEEVEDAGGTVFVNHDELGRPDALQYDRMLAAAHAHAVAQDARIADLETRLAALEAR